MTTHDLEFVYVQKTAQSVFNAVERKTAVVKAEQAARYIMSHLDLLASQYGTSDLIDIADRYTRSMLL